MKYCMTRINLTELETARQVENTGGINIVHTGMPVEEQEKFKSAFIEHLKTNEDNKSGINGSHYNLIPFVEYFKISIAEYASLTNLGYLPIRVHGGYKVFTLSSRVTDKYLGYINLENILNIYDRLTELVRLYTKDYKYIRPANIVQVERDWNLNSKLEGGLTYDLSFDYSDHTNFDLSANIYIGFPSHSHIIEIRSIDNMKILLEHLTKVYGIAML